jgi:G:T-mismatch repair DNA endonuclease (very short patch repair protein)
MDSGSSVTNAELWEAKIGRNVQRDKEVNRERRAK